LIEDIGTLDSRQLQVEEDEDDNDASGNFFFGRTTFCHKRNWGWFGNQNNFRSAGVWQLFEFLHFAHGDVPGTCGAVCDQVCDHKDCYDDYKITSGGDNCECLRDQPEYRCGENTECIQDECRCVSGYNGFPTVQCVDTNECNSDDDNNCGPNSMCINEPGTFRCECLDGYNGDPTSVEGCTDIDECTVDPGRCGKGTCVNDPPGSYTCDCDDGYAFNSQQGTCIDIDECLQNNLCGPNSQCSNRQPGYTCSCLQGFITDDLEAPNATNPCRDIKECDAAINPCGDNAICTETPGSFTCACETGYEGNPPSEVCAPTACTLANVTCADNSICVEAAGTPPGCGCPQGFTGDGVVECTDINECVEGTDDCTADENCFNRPPGSFECLIKEYRSCPVLGRDEDCSDGLQCAKKSRSESIPVCCSETGFCLDGQTECCNGAYTIGENCDSTSSEDCDGSLTCGRTVLDSTYRCCTKTSFNSILGYRVCTEL